MRYLGAEPLKVVKSAWLEETTLFCVNKSNILLYSVGVRFRRDFELSGITE